MIDVFSMHVAPKIAIIFLLELIFVYWSCVSYKTVIFFKVESWEPSGFSASFSTIYNLFTEIQFHVCIVLNSAKQKH